jgi:hypothetical protein
MPILRLIFLVFQVTESLQNKDHVMTAIPNPDKPEPRRQRISWAKRDSRLYAEIWTIRRFTSPKNVPALAGLNEITFVGSILYGIVIFTQKNSICIKILSKNVKTWLAWQS